MSAVLAERCWGIRRLRWPVDQSLFVTAFSWLEDSPQGRRQTEAVFSTLDQEEYLTSVQSDRRIDIGVFEDGVLIAKVAFHLTARHTYEVSLEAARGANAALIAEAGCVIRDQIFGLYGAQLVFAWVPRWAKGVQAILKAIGFSSDRVTMLRGTSRGRLIEWELLSLRAADEQQEQTDDHPNAEPVLQRR